MIIYGLLIASILLAFYSQIKINSTYSKYEKIHGSRGFTGAQVARIILDRSGLSDVPIHLVEGKLTDHYDPISRTVRLSEKIYQDSSIASVAIAAHEVGHAIQHQEQFGSFQLRSLIAPVAQISSQFVWILIIAGLFFSMRGLVDAGILLFSVTVLFQIITLPVEFNASSRALANLESGNFVTQDELPGARKMLNAAALTYVAATLVAILQLLRLVAMRGRD